MFQFGADRPIFLDPKISYTPSYANPVVFTTDQRGGGSILEIPELGILFITTGGGGAGYYNGGAGGNNINTTTGGGGAGGSGGYSGSNGGAGWARLYYYS